MARPFSGRKALSPVVAAIILVAVTVAVSLAVGAWLGVISFSYMEIEEIHVASHAWAQDNTYIDIAIQNKGTKPFTLASILVNGEAADNMTIINGALTLGSGESSTIRIPYNFVDGNKYEFTIKTATGKQVILEFECPK